MTSSSALKSLKITAFRGSSTTFTLPFEVGRKLTLVYGENGTGKTTICDGLEFLAQGQVGSLKDKGMGGSLERYWPSANKTLADILVVLETRDGVSCTGRFVGKQPAFEPIDARPRIELLRQQQITALVETPPAERYKTLKRFIDVEEVEKSEGALRKLVEDLGHEKENAASAELQSYAALNDNFEAAGKPAGLTPITWAKELVAAPQDSFEAELKAVELLRSIILALGAYPGLLAERQTALDAATTAMQVAQTAFDSAIELASAGAGETVKLLELGKAYLHTHPDTEVCPLCESSEKIDGLASSIEERLTQLAAVQGAQSNLARCKAIHQRAAGDRAQLDKNYSQSRTDYATARVGFDWGAQYAFPALPPPEAIADLPQWLSDAETASKTWADREAALRNGAERLAVVQAALSRYESNSERKARAEALIPKAESALEMAVKARQSFTDKIMAEIAQQVGELYDKVHPDEGLNQIALQLDPNKRASIDMQAKFAGKDVPPTAYFSQSHLDTLGLCVFLALALRDKAKEKILILDDVLGSVDEPHVERIIDMLYEVSEKFRHTVITTHYRPWREKFRWGRLKPDQKCQFIELATWDLDTGLGTRGAKPEILWLKKYLAEDEKDLQTICSKAGVILEETLDYLTWLYECRLPRREGAAYTLGELLDAVSGKLRAALKVGILVVDEDGQPAHTEIQLQSILDELSAIAKIRNVVGAHFNKLSFVMPEADTLKFAKHVEQLADALVCPDHGWPSSKKTGSYWQNGGDTRRLHPLIKPA